MQDPTEALDVNESTTSGALAYAAGVWSSLRLEPRELGVDDVTAVFQHAHRTFVHVRAFEEGFQNTFVVIISDADGVEGHILIDLQAEYADPILDCPSQDYHRITTASDIRNGSDTTSKIVCGVAWTVRVNDQLVTGAAPSGCARESAGR